MMKTFTTALTCSFILLCSLFQTPLFAQGGNALDFDGVDDLITVPTINETFHTIEFYMNYNSTLTGTGAASLPLSFSSVFQWIGLNSVKGGLADETITINTTDATATDTDIATGWHHIAIVSDGTNYTQIYIDGVAANMIATAAPVLSNTIINIGHQVPLSGFVFGGQMEEIRIWNVSRTQPEIMSTLNDELVGTETGLVAYYNFNQGVAGGVNGTVLTLPDVTGGGNDGTLSGFSLSGLVSNWVSSTAPLPVEFLSFEANKTLEGVSLDWSTTQEINNSGFEVQFSTDTEIWEDLGFVNAQGSYTEVNRYQFTHTKPVKGVNYYRLKQIDVNGAFSVSDIVSLYSSEFGSVAIYPNPSSNILTIEGIEQEGSRYRIMDQAGRIVEQADLNNLQIDISSLAKGLYLLSIDTPDRNIVERIVKK